MPDQNTTLENSYRIWITLKWYIPVDSKGYVTGFYSEGALGLVLEIKSIGKGGGSLALKIPRLQADTVRENAHINYIAEREVENVLQLLSASAGIGTPGLITPQVNIELKNQGRALNLSLEPDAVAQDGHEIFVAFEKGKPPRFCCVKQISEKVVSVLPPDVDDELNSLFRENWSEIAKLSSDSDGKRTVPFRNPVCCVVDPDKGLSAFQLASAVIPTGTFQVWYGSVPSIAFPWATGTLQKAISCNELSSWLPNDYYDLFENISDGVLTLHSNGFLHGDIRPANVMALGLLNVPKRYVLIDYGSFAYGTDGSAAKPQGGNTMNGAGVGPQRASPFYSRERRAGIERESADAVLILRNDKAGNPKKAPESYIIRLGWRERFMPKKSKTVAKNILDETRAWAESQPQQPVDDALITPRTDELRPGDRLRIQDYIFVVERADEINQDVVCVCSSRYAKVLHDRLAVYGDVGPLADETLLGLPRYTEFRQWSAASDVYSIGALALYTLFCSGQRATDKEKGTETPENAVLAEFAEMIDILESVPYFQSFWVELEKFRAILENYFDKHGEEPGANAAKVPMPDASDLKANPDTEKAEPLTPQEKEDPPVTLREFALSVAGNIVQSTPHAKDILRRFDLNLAHFLLFMHFVMCCLHRRDDMPKKSSSPKGASPEVDSPERDVEAASFAPFAADRTEPPRATGAAYQASKRLKRLKDFIGAKGVFADFKCEDGDVAEFNPTSDILVKVENLEFKARFKDLAERLTRWQQQRSHLEKPFFGKAEFDKANGLISNILEDLTHKVQFEPGK